LASLFGFLVIEGSDSDITKAPGIEGATEVLMLLSEHLPTDDKLVPNSFPGSGVLNWNSLTNGELGDETAYEFQQGSTVLFRVASAATAATIRLAIPGVTFVIVAYDGIPVPKPEEVDTVEVYNGGRVEFLARFDEAGNYTMSRLPWGGERFPDDEACQARYQMDHPCISWDIEKNVATITVRRAEDGVNLPTETLISTVELPKSTKITELESMEPVGFRQMSMDFKRSFPLFQIPYEGEFVAPGIGFGMNGRLTTPFYYVGNLTAGACETWEVVGGAHPFHAHAVRFMVTHMDAEELETPFWRDTFMSRNNFTAKACFDALKPGDVTLVHCHATGHIDLGMGVFYQVVASDEDSTTEAPTGETDAPPTKAPSGGTSGAIPYPLFLAVVSFVSCLVMLW
jgi:FtsP/CotA-like multicopper oxidase with cupredoxin domain